MQNYSGFVRQRNDGNHGNQDHHKKEYILSESKGSRTCINDNDDMVITSSCDTLMSKWEEKTYNPFR